MANSMSLQSSASSPSSLSLFRVNKVISSAGCWAIAFWVQLLIYLPALNDSLDHQFDWRISAPNLFPSFRPVYAAFFKRYMRCSYPALAD